MKLIQFIKDNKVVIISIISIIVLIFIIGLFIRSPYYDKYFGKDELKRIKEENASLDKQLKESRDSTNLLQNLAQKHKDKDTVYLNQIQIVTNENRQNHNTINSLPPDSNIRAFPNDAEEYLYSIRDTN